MDKQNKRTIRKSYITNQPFINNQNIANRDIIAPKSNLSSFDTLERNIRDKNTSEIQSDFTDSDSIRSGEKNVKKTVRKKKKNKKRKKKKSLFNFL